MSDKKAPKLKPDQLYCTAMRDLIAVRFEALWKAVPAAVVGDDIEGVHDVRVASRRLRAAMDVAVNCFPSEWYRPLQRTAKRITGALGAVRDLDVQIEAFAYERLNSPPEEWPGIDRLLSRLEADREQARQSMLEFLERLDSAQIAAEAAHRFGQHADDEAAS
jgi:CHAD domain-containing protein